MRLRHRSRMFAAVGLAMAAAIAIAGCSAPDEEAASSSAAPSAEAGALPVTIEHQFGTTTISEPVSRVAAMGVGDGDTLLALGFQPTAVATFGTPAEAKTAWNKSLWTTDPVALPEASTAFGNEIAKTLATNPQLITAVGADPTQEQYDKLAAAVPTITRPKGSTVWQVPWEDQATEIGKAVGMPEAVAAKIAEAKSHVTDKAAEYPALKGKTAVALTASADGSVSIFGPGDSRQQILESYGLTFPEGLKSAINSGFYGTISAENINLLDQADVIVVLDWEGANDQIKKNANWNRQAFVTQGRTVYINQEVGTAMGVGTVLSIPWIADQTVEPIAAAAGKATT